MNHRLWLNRRVALAVILIKRGALLPLDLVSDLYAEGIDVEALEAAYA